MNFDDLTVVLKVAEFRNITAAATSLDMRAATASAAVKRVEHELGVELFVRSTRQLRLSAAGEKYLPQCRQALTLMDEARQNIRFGTETVAGEIRLSVSSDLGRNRVVPWIDQLMTSHPGLSLRVQITDSNVDFFGIRLIWPYGMAHPVTPTCTGSKSVMSPDCSAQHPIT